VAGKTNRWLANRVDVVATTYPDAFAGIPTRRLAVVGNPIRPGFLEETPRAEARRSFDLDPKRPTLLVYGGSQGAEKINEAVIGLLARKTGDEDDPWQALWITGARAHERFKGRLEGLAGADMVRLVPFVEDMNRAYSAADLVLCRAGSASLAEASAWERPMIAVPFPWAADDHQRRNAAFFAESGACRVLEEQDLTPESLGRAVDSILGSPDLRGKMAEASADLARPEAAAELARLVLDTAGRARNASNSS
jgi:UDP-N-acetylglucosamine--N-acetylmuramyl-(pentapeptide) pyrophosphoryl-undecaprenol N-acetylglucosamine transferase